MLLLLAFLLLLLICVEWIERKKSNLKLKWETSLIFPLIHGILSNTARSRTRAQIHLHKWQCEITNTNITANGEVQNLNENFNVMLDETHETLGIIWEIFGFYSGIHRAFLFLHKIPLRVLLHFFCASLLCCFFSFMFVLLMLFSEYGNEVFFRYFEDIRNTHFAKTEENSGERWRWMLAF